MNRKVLIKVNADLQVIYSVTASVTSCIRNITKLINGMVVCVGAEFPTARPHCDLFNTCAHTLSLPDACVCACPTKPANNECFASESAPVPAFA